MAVFLAIVLTFVFTVTCQTAPPHPGTVRAENGEVVIGHMTGGSFGPGSFSVGEPGRNGTGGVGGHGGIIHNGPQGGNGGAQNHPHPTVTHDDSSIAIDRIDGGSYPDGSFSIGHGTNSVSGQGGPGDNVNGGVVYRGKDAKKDDSREDSAPDSAHSKKVASWLCSLLALLSIYV